MRAADSTVDVFHKQRVRADVPHHLCFFVRSLTGGGGAERVMLNLARALCSQGYRIDFVMGRAEGHFLNEIPDTVRVINLDVQSARRALPALLHAPRNALHLTPTLLSPDAPWVLGAAPALARYLQRERPVALLAALNYTNLAALLARCIAGIETRTVISVHNHLSTSVAHARSLRMKAMPRLARHFFPMADAIVAVSSGVAEDIARIARLPHNSISTIYNPIVTPQILTRAQEPIDHPWFAPGSPPVLLGVGKLKPQKDFPTLIRAFARLRQSHPARLIILGEGKARAQILSLAHTSGVSQDIDLPGFVANPYAYMARAAAFVLSSAWEGFGNVLVEAMACGCPVVSTDCPSGPAEILDNGTYGLLVPVGNDTALAQAMQTVLETVPDRQRLQTRAAEFSVDRAAARYLEVLLGSDKLTAKSRVT